MTSYTKCDGCGTMLDNGIDPSTKNPNYWHCELVGDSLRGTGGRAMDFTGLTAPGNRQYIHNLDKADLCIVCMAKAQEGKK
jgi:hypothetical protein